MKNELSKIKKTTVHYTTTGTNSHTNRGVSCVSKTVGAGSFIHTGHLSDESAMKLAVAHSAKRNPSDVVDARLFISRVAL